MRLNRNEVWWAATVGVNRHLDSIRRNLEHKPPLLNKALAWMNHIEGALAELAVAKWLGVVWEATVNTFRSGFDVDKYQVRWASKDHYRLILTDDDNPDHPFILVVGTAPNYKIVGWLRGRDGMRKEFIEEYDRGPAYFVPRRLMRSMADLPDE